MIDFLTFFLAPLGYAGLTVTAVGAAHGYLLARFWRGVAAVIVTHVFLVWAVRYDWQVSEATRNGYAGFLVFHGALIAIVVSLYVREAMARPLVIGAFVIVTAGALGAVFRYDVVALYRIPVMLCATAGVVGIARARLARLAPPRQPR